MVNRISNKGLGRGGLDNKVQMSSLSKGVGKGKNKKKANLQWGETNWAKEKS